MKKASPFPPAFSSLNETLLWKITKPLRLFIKAAILIRMNWRRGRRLPLKEAFKKLSDHLKSEPAIAFTYTPAPLVSIIIPIYGKLSYTLKCLASISKSPPTTPFEVIIMDDTSPDNSYEVLKKIRGLTVHRNPSNLGFIRNCNKAATLARGEFILFLNNDTIVFPGWCDTLIDTFQEFPDTGLAGSKFIFSKRKLQEAGSIIWKDGSAWNFGCKKNPNLPEFNYVKEADYCSGASILMRKSLFQKVGGFDEHYLPAYCEDSDLAFKVREAGFKVRYQPFSVVQHYRGITHGKFTFSGIKTYQVTNQQKLYERWKSVLAKENFPNGENVFYARDRSAKKPVILFMDYRVPQYDQNAGDKTLDLYMQLFLQAGFNVKLWPKNLAYDPVYTPRYQQMGIEVFYHKLFPFAAFKQWILQHQQYLNYIFISRPETIEEFLPLLDQLPNTKKLFYGHDIHYLRIQSQNSLNNNADSQFTLNEMKKFEEEVWSKMDVIYYPSDEECKTVEQYIHDKKKSIRSIPAFYYVAEEKILPTFNERKDLLFVGNFKHTPNIDGICWFIDEVFPTVLTSHPGIKLYIVGNNPPDQIIERQNDHVILLGFLSNEDLEKYYDYCRLSIAPLRFGAGVKGKVVDAMHYGLPVITTSFGAQGIPEAGKAMVITDDPASMAKALSALYDDQEKWIARSQAGHAIIQQYYSLQVLAKIFSLDIPEVKP